MNFFFFEIHKQTNYMKIVNVKRIKKMNRIELKTRDKSKTK